MFGTRFLLLSQKLILTYCFKTICLSLIYLRERSIRNPNVGFDVGFAETNQSI